MASWLSENWIGLAALLVSIVAIVLAARANSYARIEAELSRHDVAWDWHWVEPGVMEVINQSSAYSAHHIGVQVVIDDDAAVLAEQKVVGPQERVRLELPLARARFERERAAMRQKEQDQRRRTMHPGLSMPALQLDNSWMDRISHRIEWRVDWQTKTRSGLSKWASGADTGALGDFD